MTSIPDHPIEGPDAWGAAELDADDRWIHQLSNSDRTEIRDAVKQVKENRLNLFCFGRQKFQFELIGY